MPALRPGSSPPFPAHHFLLGNDTYGVTYPAEKNFLLAAMKNWPRMATELPGGHVNQRQWAESSGH